MQISSTCFLVRLYVCCCCGPCEPRFSPDSLAPVGDGHPDPDVRLVAGGGCRQPCSAGATLVGLERLGPASRATALVFIMLPGALTQVLLGLARAYLPKHYFVYVFVNAFFAGGLVTVLVALTASGLLLAAEPSCCSG